MRKGIRKILRGISAYSRIFPLMLKGRPAPGAVPSAYGVWLHPNKGDRTFQFYVQGRYGFVLADLLKKKRDDFTFLDIGANQALYSILASKNPLCTHVHAFEPVDRTADLARKNVQLNRCTNVSLHRVAISSTSGQRPIHVDDAHSGKATLRELDHTDSEKQVIETIDAAELEKIMQDSSGRIAAKIDVEGHELVVLEELLKTSFFHRIDTLFYECDKNWFDPSAAETLLRAHGFESFDIIGEGRHFDVLARRNLDSSVIR